jgi:hypothetical protein
MSLSHNSILSTTTEKANMVKCNIYKLRHAAWSSPMT